MFQILCPLGHTLEIGAEHIGQRLMCPLCSAVVHIAPFRPGTAPVAKYEVQCPQGHILRVKQKYLHKEINCPSCQQSVSMQPGMMLTVNGKTLHETSPDALKKQSRQKKETPPAKSVKSEAPPRKLSAPKSHSKRIPPPPKVSGDSDTDDETPMALDLGENDEVTTNDQVVLHKSQSITPATLPDDDFEFEIVDTQFNMELKALGIEPSSTPTSSKRDSHQQTPPPPKPPPSPSVPTGLHSLSGSEKMQVNNAAMQSGMTQFNCPNGHFLEVESKYQGMQIQCPLCKAIFTMPIR